MTEQIGSAALAMMQAAALQMDAVKAPAKSEGDSGFKKLLDQKHQSAKTDGQPQTQEQPKAEKPEAGEKQEGPVQEDAQTMAKRLAQMGMVMVSPEPAAPQADLAAEESVEEEPLQFVSLENVPEGQVITDELVQDGPVQVFRSPVQSEAEAVTEAQPEQESEARPETQRVQPQAAEAQTPVEDEVQTVRTAERPVQAAEKPETDPETEISDEPQAAPQPVFRHVEAAPVKVGETYQLEDSRQAEKADVVGQIDSRLSQAMERGESYVRIQLNPESLGSVTVEISQSADGVLRVALSAHSSETRELLQRHSADLQGLLSSRGQQTVQVEVQRQQETQQGQDQHPYDGHNGQAQDQSERQQHRRRQEHSSQDFVQQLRLGLIPEETEKI